MDIIQFADKHLGKYKTGNTELQVHKCPFCNRERSKFYVNIETGYYFCHSGSCNAKGSFERLKEHFGEKTEINFSKKKVEIVKKSLINVNPKDFEFNNSTMINWFEGRGISKETLKENSIIWCKSKNAIAFFLTDGFESIETEVNAGKKYIVGLRYRVLPKQYFSEPNSKMILFGLDQYPVEENLCFVVEGETDFLTMKEIGYKNCVSVPSGCNNFDWIEYNKKFIKDKDIVLCFDSDEAGQKATLKAFDKLQGLCKSISTIKNETRFNDLNDIYMNLGITSLISILDNPVKKEIKGIKNIKDIGRFNINDIERIKIGIKGLDFRLRGLKETELIIIGGDNSSGKTTFMSQTILQAIQQNKKVFFYNGELGEEFLKDWLFLQASGGNGVKARKDEKFGVTDYYVDDEIYKKIDRWLDKKLFVSTDGSCSDQFQILEKMKQTHEKEKCFLYVIDNLSSISFKGEGKEHELQGQFIATLKDFAKQNNICIIAVTHMTKERGHYDKKSIKGSGKVTDLADTVLLIEKNEKKDEVGRIINTESKIHIAKNRFFGTTAEVRTGFNGKTKRLFDETNKSEEEYSKYHWETVTSEEEMFFEFCENWDNK